jgi:hypothetical protein
LGDVDDRHAYSSVHGPLRYRRRLAPVQIQQAPNVIWGDLL